MTGAVDVLWKMGAGQQSRAAAMLRDAVGCYPQKTEFTTNDVDAKEVAVGKVCERCRASKAGIGLEIATDSVGTVNNRMVFFVCEECALEVAEELEEAALEKALDVRRRDEVVVLQRLSGIPQGAKGVAVWVRDSVVMVDFFEYGEHCVKSNEVTLADCEPSRE